MGDIFIPVFVGVLLIGTPLFVLWLMLSKNNEGAWDEESRVKGQLRSKRWKVKETVATTEGFLLDEDPQTWIVPKGLPGTYALSHDDSGVSWRGLTLRTSPTSTAFLLTLQLPQLSDGRLPELSEAVVRKNAGEYDVVTPDSSFPTYLDEDVRGFIEKWEVAQAFHFLGESVTVELPGVEFDEKVLENVQSAVERLIPLAQLLPREVWK